MEKIVLVISSKPFKSGKEWENYKTQIEEIFKRNPEQKVQSIFHHNELNSRKVLLSNIPTWPRIIVFDECNEGVIKRVHKTLSKKNDEVIFYAKNWGIKSHKINGINTIETMDIIPLHLTVVK